MSVANTIALAINGVSVALSLVLLLLILWQNSRSGINLSFGVIILSVMIWTAGSMLSRATAQISGMRALADIGVRLLEIGFTASCVAIYVFTMLITGGQRRIFWIVVGVALVVMVYQLIIGFSTTPIYSVRSDGTIMYSFSPFGMLLYGSFAVIGMIITWGRRQKFKVRWVPLGVVGFCSGLLLELISPQLRTLAVSLNVTTVSMLLLGYALVQTQIIEPLAGRATQLQAVRDVGLAITSQLRLEQVLSTVATQAAGILGADGAAIFLNQNDQLELAAVFNMPDGFIGHRLGREEGVAGTVSTNRTAMRLENYSRDWSGSPDMPYARQAFGSVVATPLIFANEVMGVLLVMAGLTSKRFDRDDLHLLELLGPQAAVAITNSRLFERRRVLADELESAKNQLETLLMSTENPVLALNRKLEVIFANYAATDLLGLSDLTGSVITDLMSQNVLPPDPMRTMRDLHRWRIHTYELTIRDKTYMCHLGLLGRQRAQGYVVVLNDITQLKELDRLKNQMIRMTSHDLKNPISAAMMNTELLLEEGEDILNSDLRGYANTIYAQLERMSRITAGILDLERVQSGTPSFQEIDVGHTVLAAVHEFEDYAHTNAVTLTSNISDTLPPIMADRIYLSRALANLIENAIKYTKSGGAVTVIADQNATSILIDVQDTGMGMSPDVQSRVFDRFYRAPGMEQVTGTGLGLSLVKSVVEAHKGKIWLESRVGKGTTFHISLPLRQPTAEWKKHGGNP